VFCDSSRQDNLRQTLRFLAKREPGLASRAEVVIACQDAIEQPECDLPTRVLNLRLPVFNKPMMVNAAVREAAADVIVILDGDRILPDGYFTAALAAHRPGRVSCPRTLYKLDKPYSDAEIESRQFRCVEDFRLPEPTPGRKNAFSGMAVMGRADYWLAGGMDESLVGYGCSDTDFTMTCIAKGLEIVYTEDEELHLWHRVNMSYGKFFATNLKSVCRFCRKWNVVVPDMFKVRIRDHVMM
jgi:hypothetical protein